MSATPRSWASDAVRNWALVAALLSDPGARVQYLFVSEPIRARLLVEGRRQGASAATLQAAAAVLIQPERGEDHSDHFHVRIYCPLAHRPACRDEEPYWPWFPGDPPTGAYNPLPTIHWRAPQGTATSKLSSADGTGVPPATPAATGKRPG